MYIYIFTYTHTHLSLSLSVSLSLFLCLSHTYTTLYIPLHPQYWSWLFGRETFGESPIHPWAVSMAGLSICPDWHQSVGELEKRARMCSRYLDVETVEKRMKERTILTRIDAINCSLIFLFVWQCVTCHRTICMSTKRMDNIIRKQCTIPMVKKIQDMQTTPQKWKHNIALAKWLTSTEMGILLLKFAGFSCPGPCSTASRSTAITREVLLSDRSQRKSVPHLCRCCHSNWASEQLLKTTLKPFDA